MDQKTNNIVPLLPCRVVVKIPVYNALVQHFCVCVCDSIKLDAVTLALCRYHFVAGISPGSH